MKEWQGKILTRTSNSDACVLSSALSLEQLAEVRSSRPHFPCKAAWMWSQEKFKTWAIIASIPHKEELSEKAMSIQWRIVQALKWWLSTLGTWEMFHVIFRTFSSIKLINAHCRKWKIQKSYNKKIILPSRNNHFPSTCVPMCVYTHKKLDLYVV